MNFIPVEPNLLTYMSFAFIGLGVVGALVFLLMWPVKKKISSYIIIPVVLLFMGLGNLAIGQMDTMTASPQERAAAELIAETYGIELDGDQIQELEYPRDKPVENFRAYGSIEQMLPDGDGGYELNRIFLIWEDGQMKLASSTDGESFAPLKTESN